MVGYVLYATFVPVDFIFLQAGKPGYQSIFMIFITLINVSLNFYLIPKFGLIGAAMATAIAFSCSGPVLMIMSYLTFGKKVFIKVLLANKEEPSLV